MKIVNQNALPFPFEKVYSHFADMLVKTGLPKDHDLTPMGFAVAVCDGEIAKIAPLLVEQYFGSNAGKTALGDKILQMMDDLKSMTSFAGCVVIVAEAYTKTILKEEYTGGRHDLSTDPDAQEVLLVTIHRPEAVRFGRLPIAADRSVSFEPLSEEADSITGNLTGRPADATVN